MGTSVEHFFLVRSSGSASAASGIQLRSLPWQHGLAMDGHET